MLFASNKYIRNTVGWRRGPRMWKNWKTANGRERGGRTVVLWNRKYWRGCSESGMIASIENSSRVHHQSVCMDYGSNHTNITLQRLEFSLDFSHVSLHTNTCPYVSVIKRKFSFSRENIFTLIGFHYMSSRRNDMQMTLQAVTYNIEIL